MSKKTAAPARGRSSGLPERTAYYALLAVPALVPVAVSKLPFVSGPALTQSPSVYPKLATFTVLMMVALVAWAIGLIRGPIPTRSVPLGWWLATFLGLSAVSTVTSMHPTTSFFGGNYEATGLLVLLLGSALFFLVTQLIDTAERIRALSWSVVSGGTLVALVGLLQGVGADPLRLGLEYHYGWLRVGSLLGNSDFAGSYLVVPLVIAAALALGEKDTIGRGIGTGCFAAILLCMLSTGTRGAWLGAVAGLIALGIAFVRGSGKLASSAYVAFGLAVGLPLVWALANAKSLLVRFADLSAMSDIGGGRIPLWEDAVRVAAARPLLGTGPDTYKLGWYGARSLAWVKSVGSEFVVDDPHNVVLLFAATVGIPAAIAAIGLVAGAVATSSEAALRRDASTGRLVYAGWWAALIGLSVTLLFTVNTVTMVVMVFVSLGTVLTVHSKPTDWPGPLRSVAAVAAVALGLAAGTIGTLYVTADAMLAQASRSPDRVAVAERAARIAPWHSEVRYVASTQRASDAVAALEGGLATAPEAVRLADASLGQLVASNPRDPRFLIAQAYFLATAGKYAGPDMLDRAIVAGRAAAQISPLSARAAYMTALAQFTSGDFAAAVETLEPVWDNDARFPDPGGLYFQALLSAGDITRAREVLADLQQRFPDNEQVARLGSLLETQTAVP